MRCITPVRICPGVVLVAATVFAGEAPLVTSSEDRDEEKDVVELSPFEVSASSGGYYATSVLAGTRMGATPGGFQDINFGRDLLEWGMVPRPGEITAEGLFSEYDLPTPDAERSNQLLSITGDAKVASILGKPEVTHLAQIGFSSGLDVRTWQRDPVFLVVVADVSGSMSDSMRLVKQSIGAMLAQLGPNDAFALVSFADDVRLDHAPERVTVSEAAVMKAAIDALEVRGGTNIEAGLEVGFAVARAPAAGFSGRTRVVLITDAMPNIGATTPGSFMPLAEAASLEGIGMTTIGVGLQFSADFVKQVSGVSGGNAFYFAHAGQMQEKIEEDFDFMVTELAFDIEIRVEPAAGFRFVDVYGLPDEVYARTPAGGLLLDLRTLFLSRERGAIFVSVAADRPVVDGAVLGHASLSYSLYGAAAPERSEFALAVRSERQAGLGLIRGELLINEYEALHAAGTAFYEDGRVLTALAQAQALAKLFAEDRDQDLARERDLLDNLAAFLELAAQEPELRPADLRARPEESPLVGVWRFVEEERSQMDVPADYLVFLPGGRVGFLDQYDVENMRALKWKGRHLGNGRTNRATLAVDDGRLVYRSANRASRAKASWRLERCHATDPWVLHDEKEIGESSGPSDGYYAAATLSGTRISTSLENLAASITVVGEHVLREIANEDGSK